MLDVDVMYVGCGCDVCHMQRTCLPLMRMGGPTNNAASRSRVVMFGNSSLHYSPHNHGKGHKTLHIYVTFPFNRLTSLSKQTNSNRQPTTHVCTTVSTSTTTTKKKTSRKKNTHNPGLPCLMTTYNYLGSMLLRRKQNE